MPEICEAWLKARDGKALQESQKDIVRNAELLMRALAHTGIIALVDEATGYQQIRPRDDLQRILEAYINQEFLPWTKRFPDEFYKQLFRLKNWQYNSPSVKRPKLVGKLTAELIYEKLPQGILKELRAKNPKTERENRRYKLFQFLTEEIGNPHLERHLATVTTLMRISNTWSGFKRISERAFPSAQTRLPGIDSEEQEDI